MCDYSYIFGGGLTSTNVSLHFKGRKCGMRFLYLKGKPTGSLSAVKEYAMRMLLLRGCWGLFPPPHPEIVVHKSTLMCTMKGGVQSSHLHTRWMALAVLGKTTIVECPMPCHLQGVYQPYSVKNTTNTQCIILVLN